jgi:predicted metal-dependent HD superfamily phosphohydrolase
VPALITWWKLDVAELAPNAHSDAVLAIGTDLVRRLGESHRRYHTTRHLVELFWALEDLEGAHVVSAREAAVGRMAGWFHDSVYKTTSGAGDNEIRSAELAVRDLTALGFAEDDVATVRDLVLATQAHELAHDGLPAAFHDADLWILSAPRARYDEYTVQVREEYAAVPDEVFAAARAAVLRPFLDRESIYATTFARDSWEEAARLNLAAELGTLTATTAR